jgi:hypothetical protein
LHNLHHKSHLLIYYHLKLIFLIIYWYSIMKPVKINLAKDPKKKNKKKLAYVNTTPRIWVTSASTSNISIVWATCQRRHLIGWPKMIMQMRLKVSVSQKPTRGDMWFSYPRGRSRFHPHFLDDAVCFHAILFWTVRIPSMHGCSGGGTLKHGHVYKENLWRLLRFWWEIDAWWNLRPSDPDSAQEISRVIMSRW